MNWNSDNSFYIWMDHTLKNDSNFFSTFSGQVNILINIWYMIKILSQGKQYFVNKYFKLVQKSIISDPYPHCIYFLTKNNLLYKIYVEVECRSKKKCIHPLFKVPMGFNLVFFYFPILSNRVKTQLYGNFLE